MPTKKRGKDNLHLSVDARVKRLMEIQCATEGRKIGVVTEELYRAFLSKQKSQQRKDDGEDPEPKRRAA